MRERTYLASVLTAVLPRAVLQAGGTTSWWACSAARTCRRWAFPSASSACSPSWRRRCGVGSHVFVAVLLSSPPQVCIKRSTYILLVALPRGFCNVSHAPPVKTILIGALLPAHLFANASRLPQMRERAAASGRPVRAIETEVLVGSIGSGLQVGNRSRGRAHGLHVGRVCEGLWWLWASSSQRPAAVDESGWEGVSRMPYMSVQLLPAPCVLPFFCPGTSAKRV